jgi:3-phenylpropionate/trans-cinnamate dioxygenase ferredoxin component
VSTSEQSATRLIAIDDLGASQVAVVDKTPHGALAVGISGGKPFALSNRCRHLFASLGEGQVTDEGCLQCPWHAARYDVGTGKMVRGPQGVFKPLAGVVKATTGAIPLKTFSVEVRDGAIWLVG